MNDDMLPAGTPPVGGAGRSPGPGPGGKGKARGGSARDDFWWRGGLGLGVEETKKKANEKAAEEVAGLPAWRG